ncbi:ABC transporter ATP-binding protein [Halioxenophilus aromaticivorans]|uniref:ABC transporter ATP-binding protein n=1 Tax=Halioxenophilus aromaticivorans TaxID=1306992 RepID=A0AAV3U019_9ALTE
MTEPVISINQLQKRYGRDTVVDIPQLQVEEGSIVGLIGPNGAGKTSALRCLLGLASYQGEVRVLGKDPYHQRAELMQNVAFIADTAVLPAWITATQLLDYMASVHPNFNRQKAERFLSATNIKANSKVKTLSKGMTTQLHLAMVIAIEAKVLFLDEPTLGLDIIYRQRFYEQLLNDYFDESRTIVITTHQVDEIEHILTQLIFINHGEIALNASLHDIAERFVELDVLPEHLAAAEALNPIYSRTNLGNKTLMFENIPQQQLIPLGVVRTPSIANLFVAKLDRSAGGAA